LTSPCNVSKLRNTKSILAALRGPRGRQGKQEFKFQILGASCAKCQLLERHARDAIARLGIAAEIEKVTDFDAIMDMGVMMTPALAVDGVVKRVGKVLTAEQVASYIPGGDGHAL